MRCAAAFTARLLLTPESWTDSSTATGDTTYGLLTVTGLSWQWMMPMRFVGPWSGDPRLSFTNFTSLTVWDSELLPMLFTGSQCD